MSLLRSVDREPLVLRLSRDLVRMLKRGHPWIYADALRDLPRAAAGTPAVLLDNKKGREVARGYYDPGCPLAFRACSVEDRVALDDRWAEERFARALDLRTRLFGPETTGWRLFNGEGDEVPGLIVDRYGETAVLQVDGAGPMGFWDMEGIANWAAERLGLAGVYYKSRDKSQEGRLLTGALPEEGIARFVENELKFTADVRRGQKTGFFLDQRDNREMIRRIARDRSVLNVFGYTGGFSVAAGAGGATQVTTVDLAAPAVAAADQHWRDNGFAAEQHDGVAADAFEFLADAAARRKRWDIAIVDPPSFAPSEAAVPKASASYRRLIADAARVVADGGHLAASSCSSHIDETAFLEICEEAVSEARRRGTIVSLTSQPADHPYPLVFHEFRYLKFVLMRLD